MTGEFASMRTLPSEMHAGATRLVAEAMASATLRALLPEERDGVLGRLRDADQGAPVANVFIDQASDFLDLRGDLTEWAVQTVIERATANPTPTAPPVSTSPDVGEAGDFSVPD